jgi:hypothetical protein
MLNPKLVAEAVELMKSRSPRNPAADRAAYAHIAAASQRLEGIDTSPEQVLEAADAMPPAD